MHMHFEKTTTAQSHSLIMALSWMGKVPDTDSIEDSWRMDCTSYHDDGWLATGNANGIVSVTFTTSRGRKIMDLPQRANHNLRGHHAKIKLVKWNEPYQKLASCDTAGVVFIWVKHEGRWSVELINDRGIEVTDFSWSHDGRMAVISYLDNFVLVGTVSGQRHWSTVISLGTVINCGIWSPDDKLIIFGTANGSVTVVDVAGQPVAQLTIFDNVSIISMTWSAAKFDMEEDKTAPNDFCLQSDFKDSMLAVCFENGSIYLMKNYDDLSPVVITTTLKVVQMEWSSNDNILAVTGYDIGSSSDNFYVNKIYFYHATGEMCLSNTMPFNKGPVTALSWGHDDRRLFVSAANQIFIAWISKKTPSLQLLSGIALYQSLKDEESVHVLYLPLSLQALVSNLFCSTIKCYLPNPDTLRDFVSTPPPNNIRLYCTMMRHEEANSSQSMTYTLLLEYLGGLVPILKGRRASKICPEFVIYDPHHPDENMRKFHAFQGNLKKIYVTPLANHAASSSDNNFEDTCASPRKAKDLRRQGPERPHDWNIAAEREVFTDHLPEVKTLIFTSVFSLTYWLNGHKKNYLQTCCTFSTIKREIKHFYPAIGLKICFGK